jgi:uncharacterized protein
LCCAEIVMPKYMPEGLNYEPVGLPSTESVELEPSMAVVKSPCNGICALDDQDVCRGCKRTRAQISRWYVMSDEEKLAVIKSLPIGNICQKSRQM